MVSDDDKKYIRPKWSLEVVNCDINSQLPMRTVVLNRSARSSLIDDEKKRWRSSQDVNED